MIGVGYVIDKSKWRKLNINIYIYIYTHTLIEGEYY